jgi:hypothetical protein
MSKLKTSVKVESHEMSSQKLKIGLQFESQSLGVMSKLRIEGGKVKVGIASRKSEVRIRKSKVELQKTLIELCKSGVESQKRGFKSLQSCRKLKVKSKDRN